MSDELWQKQAPSRIQKPAKAKEAKPVKKAAKKKKA
jgi:hypothetical protein